MPPGTIMIGLHYYTSPTPYNEGNDEYLRNLHDEFVAAGLLRRVSEPNAYGSMYEATDGLECWVKALTNVPWPVQVWTIPTQS